MNERGGMNNESQSTRQKKIRTYHTQNVQYGQLRPEHADDNRNSLCLTYLELEWVVATGLGNAIIDKSVTVVLTSLPISRNAWRVIYPAARKPESRKW